jgi:hypothetical protein
MDVDQLLRSCSPEAGQKEEVALLLYFYGQIQENGRATQSDIRDIIRDSGSGIRPNSVSMYFSRLEDDRWIKGNGRHGYKLTNDGIDGVEKLLPDNLFESPRDDDDQFIDSDVFEEEKYQKLVGDINSCYKYRIHDGTMVLTRKFFENMIFEILRGEYAGNDTQMFFDQENQRHYSFDELINNLKVGVPDIKRFTKESFDREMIEDIRDLKDKGNKGAHSIRVHFEDGEIEDLSTDATFFAEVLYEILKGVESANGND